MSIHTFVRFECLPGKEREFRQALLLVVEPTRAESGCMAIRIFESLREPLLFTIHSEWVDEAAFDLYAQLAHTVKLLKAAEKLLTHPVDALRTREISAGVV